MLDCGRLRVPVIPFRGGRCCHERVFARFGMAEVNLVSSDFSMALVSGMPSWVFDFNRGAPNSFVSSRLTGFKFGIGVGVSCSISGDLILLDVCARLSEDRMEEGVAASDFVGDIDLARSVEYKC